MLKTIVILTRRNLWEYFCLSASLCPWPQLAIRNLSKGSRLEFPLTLSPWWSQTDTLHSDLQAAVKPLHIFALMQKKLNVFVSEVFFPFHNNFFKSVYRDKFVLRATTNEISVPGSQTLFSWWCCPRECFINKLLKRKRLTCPPHGIVSYSGISAVYLFNLVHLKYCVRFGCHLNDLSNFFFIFHLYF